MQAFLDGFGSGFPAILSLALIAVASGLLARKGIFSEGMITGIAKGSVACFLPCLIFDKITHGFNPASMPFWWILPISALITFLIGWALTAVIFMGDMRRKPDMIPLAFMHNAGYLSVAIGQDLFPEQANAFGAYTFLYVLLYNPLLWTFGKYLISGGAERPFRVREIITPPLCANLIATAMVLAGWHRAIPRPVSSAISMLGEAAIPLSLVVLGGTLANTPFKFHHHGKDVLRAVLIKLFLMPIIAITILHLSGLAATEPMLCMFWVMQAAFPQATNLILQIRAYGGNRERASAVLLAGYTGAILTLPFWIGIWQALQSGA